MKLYKIIVFLFAASAVMAAFNTAGIFGGDSYLPNQQLSNVSSAKITELAPTNTVEGGNGAIDYLIGGTGFLVNGFGMVFEIVFSVLTIGETLKDYGVPDYIADGIFLKMLVLVAVFGLFKLISGRSDKGID